MLEVPPLREEIALAVASILAGVAWLGREWRPRRSGYGDLSLEEASRIQVVVNRAGTELRVVGSAARQARRRGSDIDYLISSAHSEVWQKLWESLPGAEHPPVETDIDLDAWSQSGILFRPFTSPRAYP